jgi:hypothetical protein
MDKTSWRWNVSPKNLESYAIVTVRNCADGGRTLSAPKAGTETFATVTKPVHAGLLWSPSRRTFGDTRKALPILL